MDFKCDELISEKTDADSRALTLEDLIMADEGNQLMGKRFKLLILLQPSLVPAF